MDLRAGIVETANALGMDPVDLATIISYETAGTFDPLKRGPTTQWGQHRGLIQFGEPQAKQYGVNWDDPLGSQLGPQGAIANYFLANGWQPGMGMMDAYSIVNAGAPGRYNASDANNGGAPGTVRDKVTGQMDGHRAKAADLLGGTFTPPAGGLSFGGGVGPVQDPSAMGLAAVFGNTGLSMGMPVPGQKRPATEQQLLAQAQQDTDTKRKIALADLMRF